MGSAAIFFAAVSICVVASLVAGTLVARRSARRRKAGLAAAWAQTVAELGFEQGEVLDPPSFGFVGRPGDVHLGRTGLGFADGHRAVVAVGHRAEGSGDGGTYLVPATWVLLYAASVGGSLTDERAAPIVHALREAGWSVHADGARRDGHLTDAKALRAALDDVARLAAIEPGGRYTYTFYDAEKVRAWETIHESLGLQLERRPARLVGTVHGVPVTVDMAHSGGVFTLLEARLSTSLGRYAAAERGGGNNVVREAFGPAPRAQTRTLGSAEWRLSGWRAIDAALFEHPVVVAALSALPDAMEGVIVEDERARLVVAGALTDPRALREALDVLVAFAQALRRLAGGDAPFR